MSPDAKSRLAVISAFLIFVGVIALWTTIVARAAT